MISCSRTDAETTIYDSSLINWHRKIINNCTNYTISCITVVFTRVNTSTLSPYVVLLSLLCSKLIFNSFPSLIKAPGE